MRLDPTFDPLQPGQWIKATTDRVSIFLSDSADRSFLSRLEAFLLASLRPRYEGRRG
jgi:hypothetical protein